MSSQGSNITLVQRARERALQRGRSRGSTGGNLEENPEFAVRRRDRIPYTPRIERSRAEHGVKQALTELEASRAAGRTNIREYGQDGEHGPGSEVSPASSVMANLRRNPLYMPIVFSCLGFLLAALAVNWYYCRYPPDEACQPGAQCTSDRWERTLTSGVIGAVSGLFFYIGVFRRKMSASSNDENSNDNDDDDEE